jgi:hypothetical protein
MSAIESKADMGTQSRLARYEFIALVKATNSAVADIIGAGHVSQPFVVAPITSVNGHGRSGALLNSLAAEKGK